MAAYFQLIRKTDPGAGPVAFATIDDEICEALGVPSDPDCYHYGWYDMIGFYLATGKSWDEIRTTLQPAKEDAADATYCAVMERLRWIATWLEERFDSPNWRASAHVDARTVPGVS